MLLPSKPAGGGFRLRFGGKKSVKLFLGVESAIGRSTKRFKLTFFFPAAKSIPGKAEILSGWADREKFRARLRRLH